MTTVRGACHCGNLDFELAWPDSIPMRFLRCGCSFCAKHGSAYVAHPRAALVARVRRRAELSRYRFGTRQAEVYLCSCCGVVTWIACDIKGTTYAVVNANSFDVPPSPDGIPLRPHDSGAPEDRLSRWARAWIPSVEISFDGE